MGKKLDIDGPAGRGEVTDKYRLNYDAIFRPEKSKKDGGTKNGEDA